MKTNNYKYMNKLIQNLFYADDDNKKALFANVINILFFVSLSLTLTIGRVYPLHYLANGIFAILCILMILYVYKFGGFFIDKFVLSIILINIFTLVSIIVNPKTGESFTLIYLTLGMLPLYFYFRLSSRSWQIAINYIAIAYFIFNVFFFTIYYKQLLTFDFSIRLGDKIGNQNDVATYLLVGHSIFLYFLLKGKFVFLPLIIINLYEMISTGSRSGLFNILLVSIFTFYLIFGKRRKLLFFISTILLSLSLYLILFIPQFEPIKQRFDTLIKELFTNQSSDVSTYLRINLLIDSVEYFLRNPIFGGGADFAANYTIDGAVAHNAIIELAARYGLIVVVLFVINFLFALLPSQSKHAIFNKIIISSFLVFYMTLSGFYYKPPYYILPLLISFNEFDVLYEFKKQRNTFYYESH